VAKQHLPQREKTAKDVNVLLVCLEVDATHPPRFTGAQIRLLIRDSPQSDVHAYRYFVRSAAGNDLDVAVLREVPHALPGDGWAST
jgi:hypothetical protein